MTSHPIVNVDLDGVCADYVAAFRVFTARRFGLDPEDLPDPSQYDLTTLTGWPYRTPGDYLAAHAEAVAQGLYANLPPIEGAIEALKALDDEGVYLRIVTHRLIVGGLHRRVIDDTARWLDECGIRYMSLCFAGEKDSIGAALHIDDAPDVVRRLRLAGQRVLVFDQLYNRSVEGPRLVSWRDGVSVVLTHLAESSKAVAPRSGHA